MNFPEPVRSVSVACPGCGTATRVLETRYVEMQNATRRRRECVGCGKRFTTIERLAEPIIIPAAQKRSRYYIEVDLRGQRPVVTIR